MAEHDKDGPDLDANDYDLVQEDIRRAFDLSDAVDIPAMAQVALWHLVEIYRRQGHRRLTFVELIGTDLYGIASVEQLQQAKDAIDKQKLSDWPGPAETIKVVN